MKAVLPAFARAHLEEGLPSELDVAWFSSRAEARVMVVDADIAWIDMQRASHTGEVAALGTQLRWLFTLFAGLDAFPLDLFAARGVTMTNGTGINAVAVAEYAVMGILVAAKRFDHVVRIADSRQWAMDAPGKVELEGTRALIIGFGAIGSLVGERLRGFGVAVDGVRRSGSGGTLRPDQWRDHLEDYDWVILAAPSTAETKALIGVAELAAMKSSAWLVNVARGDMVDQGALIDALDGGKIAGAFLDTVDPEPLPTDHPLWACANAMHTMHLSGRSQSRMHQRAAKLFLKNLSAFLEDRPMLNVVDLKAGY